MAWPSPSLNYSRQAIDTLSQYILNSHLRSHDEALKASLGRADTKQMFSHPKGDPGTPWMAHRCKSIFPIRRRIDLKMRSFSWLDNKEKRKRKERDTRMFGETSLIFFSHKRNKNVGLKISCLHRLPRHSLPTKNIGVQKGLKWIFLHIARCVVQKGKKIK